MPTLVRLRNIKLAMYPNDHNPPHFHLLTPDYAALISIETLEILSGFVPKRDYEVAMEWARNNMDVLREEWANLNGQ